MPAVGRKTHVQLGFSAVLVNSTAINGGAATILRTCIQLVHALLLGLWSRTAPCDLGLQVTTGTRKNFAQNPLPRQRHVLTPFILSGPAHQIGLIKLAGPPLSVPNTSIIDYTDRGVLNWPLRDGSLVGCASTRAWPGRTLWPWRVTVECPAAPAKPVEVMGSNMGLNTRYKVRFFSLIAEPQPFNKLVTVRLRAHNVVCNRRYAIPTDRMAQT